jgi:TctA family transporter
MSEHLLLGLQVAFSLHNMLFCLIGALLGTLVGILPGLGPVATIAVLLPITFSLQPDSALIMLAGIFYGAQYGGSTTAILLNLPGEVTSMVTALDGHQMARKGRGGVALATAALGSFLAGCFATMLIALCGPLLVMAAQQLQPADYFSIMLAGLIVAVALASGSVVSAIAMIIVGLMLGLVGIDVNSGVRRMTLGIPELNEGIDFVAMIMGLFGVTEVLSNLAHLNKPGGVTSPITSLLPNKDDVRKAFPSVVRGTLLGSICGLLPGAGVTLGSFMSYATEKRVSRYPEEFGQGAIEGVAGPESANNAAAQTAFIPLLSLGIPGNPVMAVMAGAMMIHGIAPGPLLMENHPRIFWGMIVSMWLGNLMLLVINLPLVGIWVKLLSVPYRMLFPAIIVFCAVGAYTMTNTPFNIVVMLIFGLVGFGLRSLRLEPAPLVLGFVLGPMMEENLRRALLLSRGNGLVFVERPISAFFLIAALAMLAFFVLPTMRGRREEMFADAD